METGRQSRRREDAAPPSGLPLPDALALVQRAEVALWTPEGSSALKYLRNRGLPTETIRRARLGWTAGVMLPKRDGVGQWHASGIVIPWFDADRLALIKIRRPDGNKPKYVDAFRDRPSLFPATGIVRPDKWLVVVEGELDALLLGQELADLAVVLTLGSASARPEGSTYLAMLPAPIWYIATDADQAGENAASGWPARAKRVRPPIPPRIGPRPRGLASTYAIGGSIAWGGSWTPRVRPGIGFPRNAGDRPLATRPPAS